MLQSVRPVSLSRNAIDELRNIKSKTLTDHALRDIGMRYDSGHTTVYIISGISAGAESKPSHTDKTLPSGYFVCVLEHQRIQSQINSGSLYFRIWKTNT